MAERKSMGRAGLCLHGVCMCSEPVPRAAHATLHPCRLEHPRTYAVPSDYVGIFGEGGADAETSFTRTGDYADEEDVDWELCHLVYDFSFVRVGDY